MSNKVVVPDRTTTLRERVQARHEQLMALLQPEPTRPCIQEPGARIIHDLGRNFINATALLLTLRVYGKTFYDKTLFADELKLIAVELEDIAAPKAK